MQRHEWKCDVIENINYNGTNEINFWCAKKEIM